MLNIIKRISGYCINIICWLLVVIIKLLTWFIDASMFISMAICRAIGLSLFVAFMAYMLYSFIFGIQLGLTL